MTNLLNTLRRKGGRCGLRRGRGRELLALLPLLVLAACDPGDLLDVEDPDVALPGTIEDATALPAVRASAIGDFAVAYVGDPSIGSGEGQILISGLVTDEFIHTGTFDTRESLDRRVIDNANPHIEGTFRRLHRARVSAERAVDLFERHGLNTSGHAEVQNLAGFTYIMFGENYCAGVPYSTQLEDGSFEYGDPTTTTETFERAIARFEGALSAATEAGSVDQQALAQVGEARALLGLGLYDEAAAVAALVATDFEYVINHSETSARQNNGVWSFSNSGGRWSIPNQEGANGLPFRSDGDVEGGVQDPRIPTQHIGTAQRAGLRPNEHWGPLKAPERASPTVLASGIEARLIEAEAALRNGHVTGFVTLHNELRDLYPELAPLVEGDVDAMSQEEREDLHFQERAYWLWLTSHRLGDLRRMMWDYGREQHQIFPVGAHHRAGAPYGEATNLPIPFDEQNNPNAEECMTLDDSQGRI